MGQICICPVANQTDNNNLFDLQQRPDNVEATKILTSQERQQAITVIKEEEVNHFGEYPEDERLTPLKIEETSA